jgi:hypothetical protein
MIVAAQLATPTVSTVLVLLTLSALSAALQSNFEETQEGKLGQTSVLASQATMIRTSEVL